MVCSLLGSVLARNIGSAELDSWAVSDRVLTADGRLLFRVVGVGEGLVLPSYVWNDLLQSVMDNEEDRTE